LPGSVRVASNIVGNLQNVAFLRPDGKKVLIVLNDEANSETFTVQFNNQSLSVSLEGYAVATFIW
jgi:glucosylceramidase